MKKLLLKNNYFTNLFLILLLLFTSIIFAQNVGDYRSAITGNWTTLSSWQYYNGSSWVTPSGTIPQGYPGQFAGTKNVRVDHMLTLDTNLIIGASTYTFYANVTDNGSHTLNVTTLGGALNIVNNSITTIGGSASWDNSTIFVDSGSTLVVGGLTTDNGTKITIKGGLIVNGNVIDRNNGTGTFEVSGFVYINGNYESSVGGVVVSGGGQFDTSGSITTQGSSTVLGSTNDCLGPGCSGGSLACNQTNSITPISQVLACETSNPLAITFSSVTPIVSVIRWESTTNLLTFTPIENTTNSFNPGVVTMDTWYRVVFTTSVQNCITLYSPVALVKVSKKNTVGAASSTPSLCVSTPLINITHSTMGATGIGTPTGLPSGLSAGWLSNIITISGTPTAVGEFNYTIPLTGGFCSLNATGKITVTPRPSPTFLASPSISSCLGTDVTYTTEISQNNYVWSVSGVLNTDYSITSGSLGAGSNTVTLKWLSAGSKVVTVNYNNAGGCAGTNPVTNTTLITIKTWNGLNWTIFPAAAEVDPPTISDAIVFAGNYTSSVDLSGCSCQVNAGVNIVFNAPHTLTIANAVTVTNGGTLTFKSDLNAPTSNSASLVQTNNVSSNNNSGVIKYERLTNTVVLSTDYTYWSSPVKDFTLGGVSPKTLAGKFYSFNANDDQWQQESSATVMAAGNGYIIRGPEPGSGLPSSPSPYLAVFNGVPNNGQIIIPGIIADRSYLIGNPYPSAINADILLWQNREVLDGTIYFWTHNTPIGAGVANQGSGVYGYSQDDYASYNGVGGTATSAATSVGANKNIPTGKIAAGQGFFASSKLSITGEQIVFNNGMRISGTAGNNSQFFKLNANKGNFINTIEKNRVWLNLTNLKGAFKQTLIGYVTGATNKYDSGYDGETFDGNEFLDFYSINDDVNLTIQGRALPFDKNDEVSLGYRSAIVGDFTIAIDQTDGLFATQDIFIEDKMTNTVKNLKEGVYNFSTVAGTFNNRFVLRFIQKTLGTDNFDKLEKTVFVSNKNKQIKINSSVEMIDKVEVYDLLGRSIYQKTNANTNELIISNLVSNQQTLLVKVLLQNGQSVTNKIVY
jgi:hypothetical protein